MLNLYKQYFMEDTKKSILQASYDVLVTQASYMTV